MALTQIINAGIGQITDVKLGGSGSANTLNDYEEGTWTPDPKGSTGSAGSFSATSTGSYTKIGRIVHAYCSVTFSNVGSYGGEFQIHGLPFQVDLNGSEIANGAVRVQSVSYDSGASCTIEAFDGISYVRIQASQTGTGNNPVQYSELGNSSFVAMTITYKTDS